MQAKTAQKILKKVRRDYEEISDDFNQTRKSDWKEFNLFLDYIKNRDHLADLGCGNGRFYNFLKKHRKINYIGIDNSKALLKHARKELKEVKFVEGSLLELPLKNNSIDVAVAIASLHHIPSKKLRKKTLEEIFRVIKLNGLAIITVWNLFQAKYKKYIWKSRLRHILSLGKYDSRDTFIPWGKTGVKRYYYAFKAVELKKLLAQNNFKIIFEHIGNNITFVCKKSWE